MVEPVTPHHQAQGPSSEEAAGPSRRRYFDRRLNAMVVSVCQGDYYVTARSNELLTTLLGSCIAVCMRDPKTGYGGMNHFVLPAQSPHNGNLPSATLRYGSYSIERLMNELVAKGAKRARLEIKVFGGANIIVGPRNFGHANADFVERYFAREGLRIVAKDLRGTVARRLRYSPVTGVAHVSYSAPLATPTGRSLAEIEADVASRVNYSDRERQIEIFRR